MEAILPLLATAIVTSVVAAMVAWNVKPTPPARLGRFSIVLPDGQAFTRARSQVLAISPDGSLLVYVANRQLYARRLAELDAQPIAGTALDVSSPFFSPDGRWIGFFSFEDLGIKKIPVFGGSAVTVCSGCAGTLGYGMSWEGNTIVFARGGQEIVGVPDTGGKPEVWVKAGANEAISSPQLLPDSNALLFSVNRSADARDPSTSWDMADIVVQSRATGQRKVIVQGGSGARYVDTGHLVYSLNGTLHAVPFDLQRLETTGDPVPIVQNVMRPSSGGYGPANFDVSRSGTLVYATGSATGGDVLRVLAVGDRRGGMSRIPGLAPGYFASPRVSPDGRFIALEVTDEGSIAIHDMSGQSQLRRLTLEGINTAPVWSPDSKRVAFRSNRGGLIGLFVQNADGSGGSEQLTTATASAQEAPFAWSPDGNYLAFARDRRPWAIALNSERKLIPLSASEAINAGSYISFSPNGRWITVAALGGRPSGLRVYVQRFPTGQPYLVSRELAQAPVWSHDGKELFYYQTETRRLVSVRVQTEPSFSISDPTVVPIASMMQNEGGLRNFDVLRDGRVLVVQPVAQQSGAAPRLEQRIDVVLNWTEELMQRVPRRR